MDKNPQAARMPNRIYTDFEPISEQVEGEDHQTIILSLPGFKEEELRVQRTPTGILEITGERQVKDNEWSRFHKEFIISPNCDTDKITAQCEDGVLYIIQPQLITPATEQEKEKPMGDAEKPMDEPQPRRSKIQDAPETRVLNTIIYAKEAPEPKELSNADGEKSKSMGEAQKPMDEPQPRRSKIQDKGNSQKTEKTNGLANAKDAPDTKEWSNAYGEKNKSMDAKNVTEKTPGEENSDDVKTTDGNFTRKTSGKHESLGDNVIDAKMDGGTASNVHDGGKIGTENYKQPVGGLAEKLAKSRKLMKWTLVILIALVLEICVTNFFRSSKTDTCN